MISNQENPLKVEDKDHPIKKTSRLVRELIYFSLSFLIIGIGVITYKDYEYNFGIQIKNEIASVAELKVSDIENWRNEKLGDAMVLFNNDEFIDLVRDYYNNPTDSNIIENLTNWLEKYNEAYQYSKLFLLDNKLNIKLTSPLPDEKLSTEILNNSQIAMDSKKVIFQDLYLNEFTQKPYLGLLVPILDYKNNQSPLGLLYMRINPETYLYPYISAWPVPSDTSETALVRRDGDSVLFLNELKFQEDTTLKLRIPLTNTLVPAVQAVSGVVGLSDGKDYIGTDVVSYLKPVKDSPWFVITKISTAEANKPLQERLYVTIGMVVLMIAVMATTFGMIWTRRDAKYYKEKAIKDEELRKTKEFLESLLKYANSQIVVWDKQYKITQFNNAFQKLTGHTEAEVLGQDIRILFPKDKIEESMQIIKGTEQGKRWESVEMNIVSTKGEVFTVIWNSATIYSQDGKTAIGTVAIGQDITNRKIAEKNQEENVEQLQKINNVMIDRELKMVELKNEIEELKKKLGQNI